MQTSTSPARCRHDGVSPSAPADDVAFDVITFRRQLAGGAVIELTIDRAKLARRIAQRAERSSTGRATSWCRAITAVLIDDAPTAEAV